MKGANLAPARRYLDAVAGPDGPGDPAVPRLASTVLLLREAEAPQPGRPGVQVFMQSRVAAMAFAPGVTVFPGGGVDPRDADPGLPMSGPHLSWWSERLECAPETARGLLAAACREIYEECGVLLAGRAGGGAAAAHSRSEGVEELFGGEAQAVAAREQLTSGAVSLTEVLRATGLELRSELLTPYARWITPEYHSRRYDTFMFLARMPHGQHADGRSTETERADWVRPSDVLRDLHEERLTMLPPTIVALERLEPPNAPAADAPAITAEEWLTRLQRREWHMGAVTPQLISAEDGTPTLICEVT